MGYHLPSVLVYLTITVASGMVDDQRYCAVRYRRLCQGKGRHVGCQFPESGPGVSCRNYSPIQFHNDLKHFITHYINRRRQRIASGSERVRGGMHLPKPQIMMMVEWDRELATLAQRLADQCHFVHDDCRATVRYPYAGQTVGEVRWRRSSDSDSLTAQRAIRRVFDAWWGERRRVQPQQLTQPFRLTAKGAVWGHFSQLAVWSLRAVGCGAVRHGTSYPRMLLVCDFSHTNMLGQRTLSPGPMMPCPIHTARKPRSAYPLLCAPVRHKIQTEPEYDSEIEEEADAYDEDEETMETGDDELLRNESLTVARLITTTVSRSRSDWRKNLRASTKIKITEDTREENESAKSINYRTIVIRKTTRGIFMDRLDQELEGRLKAQHKFMKYHEWQSRSTLEPRVAAHGQYQTVHIKDPYIRRTTLSGREELDNDQSIDPSLEPTLLVRHKWKQTRDRPKRPGANALLNIPVTAHTHRSSFVSAMMFDKEDVDQLFKDTGFNPSWMKQKL